MNQRHAHPHANFHAVLREMNIGAHAEALARERLQYLAGEFNGVDVARFRVAVENMIDETPGLAAAVAEHRARDSQLKAHAKTFGTGE